MTKDAKKSAKAAPAPAAVATTTPAKRVTLRDVARAANVATGTVSMVLNNSPSIAPATQEHVRAIIQELGYVYDRAAGNLRNKRSNIVGVSMCNLLNPYFFELLAQIQKVVTGMQRVPILGDNEEDATHQDSFLRTLLEYKVEGIFVTPTIGTTAKQLNTALSWGIPMVQVTRYVPGVQADYVGSDNLQATELTTQHLIGLKHKRIAFVGNNPDTSTGRDRYAGFINTMRKARIAVQDDYVVTCLATRENGFAAAAQLMALKTPPTAIVCFDDEIAFGVMLGLRHLGKEPGRDCAIVGAVDVGEARLWQPGLTSVAINQQEIAQEAGRMLAARMENPDKPIERHLVAPRLVVRGSCGAMVKS